MQKLKSKLSGKLRVLVVPFFVLILMIFMGCASFQDIVTPCYIDSDAMQYAGVEPNDVKVLGLYTSLWDAKRLGRRMDRTTSENQKQLTRMIIDDADAHAYVSGNHLVYIQEAEEFKQTVFSPSGPIGMMLPALAGLGLGAFAISKPKDKKEIELLHKAAEPVATRTT